MQIPGMPIPVSFSSALVSPAPQGASAIAPAPELSVAEPPLAVPIGEEAIRTEPDQLAFSFVDLFLQDPTASPMDQMALVLLPAMSALPMLNEADVRSGHADEASGLLQLPGVGLDASPNTNFFASDPMTFELPVKAILATIFADPSKEVMLFRAALGGEDIGLPDSAASASTSVGRQNLQSRADGLDLQWERVSGLKEARLEGQDFQANGPTLAAGIIALGSEVIAPESALRAEQPTLENKAKALDGLKSISGSGVLDAQQVMDAPLLVHADWTKGSPAKALPGASDSVWRISVGAPEGRMPIPLVPIPVPLISAPSIIPSGPVADPLIPLASLDGLASIKAVGVKSEPAARPGLQPEALFLRYELEEALRSGAPPHLSKGQDGIEVRKVAAPESAPLATDVDQSGLVATLPVLGPAEMTAVEDSGLATLADLHPGPGPATPVEIGKTAGPILSQITSQLIERFAQGANGSTTVTLSPEELGQVRISFQPDAQNLDRIVVMLSFDRPETMDLFRRNADQLAEALRTAGYSGVQMGFGGLGGEGFRQRSSETLVPDPSPLASAPLNETATPASIPRPTGLGALDLRL